MLSVILFNFDLVVEMIPIVLMVPIQWVFTRLIQQFITLRLRNFELARKIRELAIVNEVSQAVSFMGNLPKTLDAILSRSVQVLGAERGSLLLLDEKYDQLITKSAIYGVAEDAEISEELKEAFKEGKGVAGEVFSSTKQS